MNYKLSRTLMWVNLLVALVFCAASAMTQTDWPGIVGIVLAVLGILQAGIFYRCPHCRCSLFNRGRPFKFCPNCGERLEED